MPRKIATAVLDLLYPPCCHVCGRRTAPLVKGAICTDCLGQVKFLTSPLCSCCGAQLPKTTGAVDHHCTDCLRTAPSFDSARSLFLYESPVRDLLHRLKYRGDTTVSRAIVLLVKSAPRTGPEFTCDAIIPVPLFVSRLRQRGINQALFLARLAFPGHKDKITTDLLVRTKNTVPQTALDGAKRRRNLRGAFAITDPERVRRNRFLLVDDVFTTGTTVAECSRTLKKYGAAAVHVWTFARAQTVID